MQVLFKKNYHKILRHNKNKHLIQLYDLDNSENNCTFTCDSKKVCISDLGYCYINDEDGTLHHIWINPGGVEDHVYEIKDYHSIEVLAYNQNAVLISGRSISGDHVMLIYSLLERRVLLKLLGFPKETVKGFFLLPSRKVFLLLDITLRIPCIYPDDSDQQDTYGYVASYKECLISDSLLTRKDTLSVSRYEHGPCAISEIHDEHNITFSLSGFLDDLALPVELTSNGLIYDSNSFIIVTDLTEGAIKRVIRKDSFIPRDTVWEGIQLFYDEEEDVLAMASKNTVRYFKAIRHSFCNTDLNSAYAAFTADPSSKSKLMDLNQTFYSSLYALSERKSYIECKE